MLWCSLKQRNTFAHRAAYSGDCISLVTHPFYPDKRGDKIFMAIPYNSKCRYGERGAADAKPKAQIILDAAKVSAASGGNSEPKQGQRSQSARGFCPRSTMRVPQPDIIEHFGNADAVPQLPERCLSRQAGIVRCCLRFMPVRGVGNAAPTTNLLVRYTFLMKNRIRPRRSRVTPPYREFTGL